MTQRCVICNQPAYGPMVRGAHRACYYKARRCGQTHLLHPARSNVAIRRPWQDGCGADVLRALQAGPATLVELAAALPQWCRGYISGELVRLHKAGQIRIKERRMGTGRPAVWEVTQ